MLLTEHDIAQLDAAITAAGSIAAFCRERHIAYTTVNNWKHEHKAAAPLWARVITHPHAPEGMAASTPSASAPAAPAVLDRSDNSDKSDRSQLTVNTIVRLETGGPLMAVLRHDPTGELCIWFDGSELCRHAFPAELLQVVYYQPKEA